jgi:hypothetical protein
VQASSQFLFEDLEFRPQPLGHRPPKHDELSISSPCACVFLHWSAHRSNT